MVLRRWRAVTALFAAIIGTSALAQSVDPRVLQQLQGQLSGSSSTISNQPSISPLDQARTDTSSAEQPAAGRLDTIEEQELRRQQSRSQLDRLYAPSPIEREFRNRLADPTLRQFGYDLFQSASRATPGPLTGAVSDSYVVGIGDELVVQFQGATNESRTVRVDREGRLIVGALAPIPAAGRTIGSLRRDLSAQTKRTLLGTEVYVSLGAVRAITVFVGGEVDRPGQYNLTSQADVGSALALAGGIRRSGSLRNVRIVRAGGGITVDLYGLIGIGTPPASRLQDGDRIIVPVIGDTVAVAGAVARPGIYEVRRGTSVGAVLDYAGGALRPRGNTIAISRIDAGGAEVFVKAASLASNIQPGDAIQLVGGSAGGATGRVVLRGYVQNPGPRPLVAVPTVRDLLGDVADLRFDTYLPMAILIRRDPATAAREFEPVNLIDALRSRPPVPLRSDDRLYVFSRTDIAFLNQTPVRRVVLGQANPYPECRSLARLEALVGDSKSARFDAVTRGALIVERNGQSDVAVGGNIQNSGRRGDESFRTGGDALAAQGAGQAQAGQPGQAQLAQAQLYQAQGGQNSQYPFAQANSQDRTASDRALPADLTGDGSMLANDRRPVSRCPAVFEEEPDLLPVLIENAVGVGGAIRNPGAYPVAGSISARDVAAIAQGLIPNVDNLTLDLTSGNGERRIPVTGAAVLASVSIRSGDDLRFNGAQPQFESGGVLLTGEFGRPGLYTIRKGEKLSELIARAGGISSLGYPYGTIFTRRSVKEAQQEGIRRTGRELTNALLAVSARKTGSGSSDSTASAVRLIDQLSSVEAPGRVVIEADPRALALRPDLDTVLESGDTVYLPKRPNFVLALGDVSNPGALQFVAGKSAREYLSETGGTAKTADKRRIFLVLPNGTAQPLRNVTKRSEKIIVPPGSTIIVPKDIDPLFTLDVVRDVSGILGTLITSIATIAILAK
nr:SLBB domain-containing protein [Polymorphobacter sp.]